jgi:hypothetical protein
MRLVMAKRDTDPDVPRAIVLFVDIEPVTGRPVAVPFVPTRDLPRALKFLYWSEEAPDASAIIAVGSTHILSHQMVRLAAKLSEARLAGAGEIKDSQVASWGSTGYGLRTPPDLQTFILRALGLGK